MLKSNLVDEPFRTVRKRSLYCSVPNCRNSKLNAKCTSSGELPSKSKLHRLPENKKVRQEWFDFLKKYNVFVENVSVSYYLCDDHFDESCFLRDLKSELLYNKPQTVLQKGSIPSIYLTKKNKRLPEDCQTQTIEDILKEYEDKTEDFVSFTFKSIHMKRSFCCIINCNSATRTAKLYSVERYKLLNKIPTQFIDNSGSKDYICIKHFDQKYLNEVQIFRKDADFKINLITDFDLVKDAVPTIFTESSNSNLLRIPNNCNDEIELQFDELLKTDTETEKVQIFDLPEINTIDANIIARNKICRICFSTTNEILEANNLGKFKKKKNDLKFEITNLGKRFEASLNLKVLDVPNCMNICTECKSLLESFENFKIKSVESNKQFLNIFHNIDWMDIEIEKINLIETQIQKEKFCPNKTLKKIVIKIHPSDTDGDSKDHLSKNILVKSGVDSNSPINVHTSSQIGQSIIKKLVPNQNKVCKLSKEKCPHCRTILTSSYLLQLHIERIHSIENRTCEICNKILRTSRYLRLHMGTVHSESNKFFCEHCGKGFKALRNLALHKLVHTNVRKYTCTISGCGKKFKRANHLKQHIGYHKNSDNSGLRLKKPRQKHICDICGKEICSSLMNSHTASHMHNYLTINTGSSESRYKCPHCERNYKNVRNLKRHLRLAHNVKAMFTCSKVNCKFKCRIKEKLHQHELKHDQKLEVKMFSQETKNTDENQIINTLSAEKNEYCNQPLNNGIIDGIMYEEYIDDSFKEIEIKEEISSITYRYEKDEDI